MQPPRQARLQPVLHVLHVAQHPRRARGVRHGARRRGIAEYFRPNFFANTPDILHEYLQHGGRAAFEARLVLAATLSPSYGIYSGFEWYENEPLRAGSEEYLGLGEVRGQAPRRSTARCSPLVARAQRDPAGVRRRSSTSTTSRSSSPATTQLIVLREAGGTATPSSCASTSTRSSFAEGAGRSPADARAPGDRSRSSMLLTGAEYRWRTGDNYLLLVPGPRPRDAGPHDLGRRRAHATRDARGDPPRDRVVGATEPRQPVVRLRPELVPVGRLLRDPRPRVRRRQRRRHRRLRRAHRPARLPPVARRRLHLAAADVPVAVA